jgi:bacteriophage exclusion system BrxC/D-like protein
MEGQSDLLSQGTADLEHVAQGGSASLIIRGQYGERKTHLLSAIENKASAKGFAVSTVVLSKETPFNRINKVYEAVAHAVEAPSLPRLGFEDLLLKLRPGEAAMDDILSYAEQHLHPKILYVLKNYLQEGDPLKRAQLYDDLAGSPLTMADLRAIHRGNFHEPMRLPRRFLIQDTIDYFRFLAFLLRRSGYKGWVITMDEVELLSKLGVASRAEAYVNLAILLGLKDMQQALSGVYLVLALVTPFIAETLLAAGRHDLEKVSQWFQRRNRAEDERVAAATMHSLIENSVPLEPLAEVNMQAIMTRLEECHNLGYGWDGKLDSAFVTARVLAQVANPTRTTIRAALEYLDLLYQYGRPPDIAVQAPDTGSLEEDSRFEGSDSDQDQG